MKEADIIVVGGGPAGSTCAWKLREGGADVLILDRQEFPRPKPCAGWVTPFALRRLNVDPGTYPLNIVRFDRLLIHLRGRRFPLPTRQYAVRRVEFDHWLLERAAVPVRLHTVRRIEKEKGYYLIDGMFRCRVLVGAGGSSCPVYRALFREGRARPPGAHISAMESEYKGDPRTRQCLLWFSGSLPGYAWFVPKENGYVNIGVGGKSAAMKAGKIHLRDHWDALLHTAKNLSLVERLPSENHGYAYYIRHAPGPVQVDNAYVIGDAVGVATKDLGEGISPAVETGLRAARAILGGSRYTLRGIPKYSLVDLLFPWRP